MEKLFWGQLAKIAGEGLIALLCLGGVIYLKMCFNNLVKDVNQKLDAFVPEKEVDLKLQIVVTMLDGLKEDIGEVKQQLIKLNGGK